jgi:hypothetical protein
VLGYATWIFAASTILGEENERRAVVYKEQTYGGFYRGLEAQHEIDLSKTKQPRKFLIASAIWRPIQVRS